MEYISTRGSKVGSFQSVLMKGLAQDGGLFIPNVWPQINTNELRSDLSYENLTAKIIQPFIGSEINDDDLRSIIKSAYKDFSSPDPVTFKKLSRGETVVELFNGPTLAFKDFAMQLLIPIFDYFLDKENRQMNLIVATSGDTGSAAIQAVNKSKNLNIYCLYPKNRISEFQRRQMSTVKSNKINLCEINGTFDDCQNIVKEILADNEFSGKYNISAVNSINWARVMIQVVYYFFSALRQDNCESKYNFSVPTGNFGDVYAGYIAKKMGLNINRLIVATNENDILDRFFKTGQYMSREVVKTSSPSMDIQVASNFERLLFDALNRSSSEINEKMNNFKINGNISVTSQSLEVCQSYFSSEKVDMKSVEKVIMDTYETDGYLVDPHTAIGIHASRQSQQIENNFILGTAHPVKFLDTVEDSIQSKTNLLNGYEKLFEATEKFDSLNNNVDEVKLKIESSN